MANNLRTQIGQFAMVPLWVLERVMDVVRQEEKDADAAARAVHLYAVLGAKFANREQRAWPKREQLAEALNVSLPSIARSLRVLRAAGALNTERRHRPDGAVIGLDYLLIQIEPNGAESATGHQVSGDTKVPDRLRFYPDAMEADPHQVSGDSKGSRLRIQLDQPFVSREIPLLKEEPDPINQIQEQEQERVREDAQPALLSVQIVEPSVEDFAALWNATTTLPILRCARLTEKRRRHARTRLAERPWEEWRGILERIERSAFCRGENDRGWTASFGWFISSPDVAVKALEGVYDDRQKPERPFSATELADARRMREASGGCMHDPRCVDFQACIAAIIRGWRLKREGRVA